MQLTVFVHIPKTAGTTFTSVLRDNYRLTGIHSVGNVVKGAGGVDVDKLSRLNESEVLSALWHATSPRLLRGHLPFAIRELLPPDAGYITFLRDPVERTLSHYHSVVGVRREQLPEDVSLESLLEERRYLLDNLQTRMLSIPFDPFGEATEEMLEQAKENLRDAFLAFGLAERFDESLVLLKRRLGLRSILYAHHERQGIRPHGTEIPAELVGIAERFNAYDLELHRFASELFDQAIAEQDGFAVEVAALTALSGGRLDQRTHVSDGSHDELSELLATGRTELLAHVLELVEARNASALRDLRLLLREANATIGEVRRRVESIEGKVRSDVTPEPPTETPADAAGMKVRKPRKRAAPEEEGS